MDKISKLLLCHMPGSACNLRCEYCYITNQNLWNQKITKLDHSPQEIVYAMRPERVGGLAIINFCGSGETLLSHESIELLKGWAQSGHYIEVVTNGTITKRFEEIAAFPEELRRHITFKFSFHYAELKRLGMIEKYFNNVMLMHKAGCSFTVEMTPYDGLDDQIDEILACCDHYLGHPCQLTIARDDTKKGIPVMSGKTLEEYCDFWSPFHSTMLDFKKSFYGVKRKEFCYAGMYSANIRLATGGYSKCYNAPVCGNIFDHPDKPIKFEAIGHCPVAHCYNGHAHLALGLIPTLDTPTYAYIRNIPLKDGTDSLTDTFKDIYSQKVSDNNKRLGQLQQSWIRSKTMFRQGLYGGRCLLVDIKHRIFDR